MKSLTWDSWFSWTVIFWCFNSLGFVAETPISPGSSLTYSGQYLRIFWDAVYLAQVFSFVCQITHNSQLVGCMFFSVSRALGWETKCDTENWRRVTKSASQLWALGAPEAHFSDGTAQYPMVLGCVELTLKDIGLLRCRSDGRVHEDKLLLCLL